MSDFTRLHRADYQAEVDHSQIVYDQFKADQVSNRFHKHLVQCTAAVFNLIRSVVKKLELQSGSRNRIFTARPVRAPKFNLIPAYAVSWVHGSVWNDIIIGSYIIAGTRIAKIIDQYISSLKSAIECTNHSTADIINISEPQSARINFIMCSNTGIGNGLEVHKFLSPLTRLDRSVYRPTVKDHNLRTSVWKVNLAKCFYQIESTTD